MNKNQTTRKGEKREIGIASSGNSSITWICSISSDGCFIPFLSFRTLFLLSNLYFFSVSFFSYLSISLFSSEVSLSQLLYYSMKIITLSVLFEALSFSFFSSLFAILFLFYIFSLFSFFPLSSLTLWICIFLCRSISIFKFALFHSEFVSSSISSFYIFLYSFSRS